VDGDLDDLAALLVGERGVLAERAVGADAAAAVADEEVAVLGEPVVVDRESGGRLRVLLEGQGGGDDDAAQVELLVGHGVSYLSSPGRHRAWGEARRGRRGGWARPGAAGRRCRRRERGPLR